MKRTGLNGYVYDFNVDYGSIPGGISKILWTCHDYPMFKYDIRKCLDLLNDVF